jgi:hypothetical protein
MLNWIKTRHEKGHENNPNMPDNIVWEAILPFGYKLYIWSHPYSGGEWTTECKELMFGGKYCWLNTKDEKEAKLRTEIALKKFLKNSIDRDTLIMESI